LPDRVIETVVPVHNSLGVIKVPCISFKDMTICTIPCFRLRLTDGRYIYMEYHHYLGPNFYRDRKNIRFIEQWWDDPYIVESFEWFESRGKKA